MIGKIKVTTDTFDDFPEFTELWNQWLKTPDGAIYEAGYGDFESMWRAERGRSWVYRRIIQRLRGELALATQGPPSAGATS